MRLLIDTDTGSDDAVALIMALRDPGAEVVAITTVAGNVEVEQATRNALYVAELCGADVGVYEGARRPLVREPRFAYHYHGSDGLGDRGYRPSRAVASPGHAVDVLIEAARANAGELTVVTLGPLTNVALALRRAPEIASMVRRWVVMGGAACTVGNITPAAEFNVYVDPEAAQIVLASGLPVEMVGWELCRGPANLGDAEMGRIRDLDTTAAHFALDCNATALRANREGLGEPGLGLADAAAMAVALDPETVVEASHCPVTVETASTLTRGMTVVDRLGVTGGEPNVRVVWAIDVPRFKERLYRALER